MYIYICICIYILSCYDWSVISYESRSQILVVKNELFGKEPKACMATHILNYNLLCFTSLYFPTPKVLIISTRTSLIVSIIHALIPFKPTSASSQWKQTLTSNMYIHVIVCLLVLCHFGERFSKLGIDLKLA